MPEYIQTASFDQLIDLINGMANTQINETVLDALNERGLEFNFIVSNPYWIDANGNIHFDVIIEFTNNPAEPEPVSIFSMPKGGFPWLVLIAVLLVILLLSKAK